MQDDTRNTTHDHRPNHNDDDDECDGDDDVSAGGEIGGARAVGAGGGRG